jgi:FixJ family two-component response regulator
MDGVDLATRLRAAGHAGRFLFISGYCDLESLEDRLRGLNASFLAKPFSIPELIRVVRGMLDDQLTVRQSARLRRQASH